MKANRKLVLASLALALLAGTADAQRRASRHDYGKNSGRVTASHVAFGRGQSAYTRAGSVLSSQRSVYGTRSYCAPQPIWVAGHYELVERVEWVPGCTERVWVAPIYETRFDACGLEIRVLIRNGHYRDVQTPGRYVTRSVRTWIPGHWSYR